MNLLNKLFGKKQHAAADGQSARDDAALKDPRVTKAIAALMVNVTLSVQSTEVKGTGSDGPVMAAANWFKELHEAFPQSPTLHFAWAAALQVAAQGQTAASVLEECVQTHPNFWLAKATQQQNALLTWNPFLLPEFNPQPNTQVHPVINRMVSTNTLIATRQGILPHAVIFLRDSANEFSVSLLSSCKIEFATTISEVTNPQVVAINGRIHDDPTNPYQCEIVNCPILPFGDKERLPYELFVRQPTYDFAILDAAGKVKYLRQLTPSNRTKSTHAKLTQIFETQEGPKLSTGDLMNAITRHQASFGPDQVVW